MVHNGTNFRRGERHGSEIAARRCRIRRIQKPEARLVRREPKGGTRCNARHLLLGVPARLARRCRAHRHGQAQDSIYVPLLTYRTGPFAGSRHSDRQRHERLSRDAQRARRRHRRREDRRRGMRDRLRHQEGRRMLREVKGKKPVVVNPYSTGITLQLIPKAAVDKIPVLSMAYGLSASAGGNNFPWIFNPPATYWDGAVDDHQVHRRARKAASTSSRARRSATSSSTAATAASRSRCSSSSPRNTASP